MKNDSTPQVSAVAPSPGVGSSDLFGAWTPVEQAVPDLQKIVLVCERAHDGTLYLSTLAFRQLKTPWVQGATETEWRVEMNCGGYECEPDDCNPTHWMPLPSLPSPNS